MNSDKIGKSYSTWTGKIVGFICFWIGIIVASIFYYKTDNWRIRKLLTKGYDNAVRDIVEFGFYYNTPNNSLPIFWSKKEWYPIFERKVKLYNARDIELSNKFI